MAYQNRIDPAHLVFIDETWTKTNMALRIGDKKSDREDDLLDTFCSGIALALGDNEGV